MILDQVNDPATRPSIAGAMDQSFNTDISQLMAVLGTHEQDLNELMSTLQK